jgi:hypothetical protein
MYLSLALTHLRTAVKRMTGEQTEYEPTKHDCTECKNRVANHAHPAQFIHKPLCMNSAERAYQVPYSSDAHACSSPTGSTLNSTIRASPQLMDQNAINKGLSFQAGPGLKARRQNSISPSPSIP